MTVMHLKFAVILELSRMDIKEIFEDRGESNCRFRYVSCLRFLARGAFLGSIKLQLSQTTSSYDTKEHGTSIAIISTSERSDSVISSLLPARAGLALSY